MSNLLQDYQDDTRSSRSGSKTITPRGRGHFCGGTSLQGRRRQHASLSKTFKDAGKNDIELRASLGTVRMALGLAQ